MQKLGLNEIREKYLSFFESKGHLRLPSFSLVPENDKSLLLINAGMAPLKPYFKGELEPPRSRVTTCQKCIRTPDIERVGKTARHGTYFEMLGNFSFGDYFKHEATAWAWEFVTKVLELPTDKLWITIYEDDDEAFDIWTKEVGVDPEHIVRMGKEDNFWEIGTGPCGPCSELYFDRGVEHGCGSPDCKVGCECDRFVEFWNLVFTQFDKDEAGNYNRLSHPNIDTGMGLERIACIMQGVNNLFEVDTVRNIMLKISEITGATYGADEKNDVSLRVITDHIRSTTFMIGDGVQISNEGRGYVLRRLLRHAARHGKLLGVNEPFLYKVCDTVIEENKNAYPELVEKQAYIKKVIELEEIRFNETINDGLNILAGYIAELQKNDEVQLSGEKAFKLYDTFGFPLDLTLEILEEKSMNVNVEEYEECMQAQKKKAREGRGETDDAGWEKDEFKKKITDLDKAEFVGYDALYGAATVKAIGYDGDLKNMATSDNGSVAVVLDKTPFYGEGGGQVGDKGTIKSEGATLKVTDTKKVGNGQIMHICTVESGMISVGDSVECQVCQCRRNAIARNHSATHLLQKALKTVLGDHVQQAGSYVDAERLRFDFSHFEALSKDQIAEVEKMVNNEIYNALNVECKEMPIDEARALGAMALFGEKYGDVVRVVKMGDYSVELCGGTHVCNTSNIGIMKIVSETSAAAGVRRIEAITGLNVLDAYNEKEETIAKASAMLKSTPADMLSKLSALQNEVKAMQKEIEAMKSKLASGGIDDIKKNAITIGGTTVLTGALKGADVNTVRKMNDSFKDEYTDVVCVMATEFGGKVMLITAADKAAVGKGAHCGMLVKAIASHVGGSGGGKPESAQAGGSDASGIDAALAAAIEVLKEQIK
ncbi:MAG: alanine--tRNA ligase [Ruminococcaceae bacterium]|nr:alanine--tRNA ligase [Oscillospiraceae bacterium]